MFAEDVTSPAKEEIKELLESSYDEPDIKKYLVEALSHMNNGDTNRALECLNICAIIDEGFEVAIDLLCLEAGIFPSCHWLDLAWRFCNDDPDFALRALNRAILWTPIVPECWIFKSEIHKALGESSDAQMAFNVFRLVVERYCSC